MFYQRGATATAGGTAINTRTEGAVITLTGGREITHLINTVAIQASLLSEHINGFIEYQSSDFQTSFPYRVQVTAMNAGLGATSDHNGGAGIKIFKMPIGQGIPIAGRTVIQSFFTQMDDMGTAPFFNSCVGYIK